VLRDGTFESLGFVTHSDRNLLVFLESDRFLDRLLRNPNISCVTTTSALAERLPDHIGIAVTENPRRVFCQFHNYLTEHTNFYWQDFPTETADDAVISPSAYIAERNVRIGQRVIIEPNVTVLERSIIGNDVIIRAGTVIGCQGFEFKRIGDDVLLVAHAGGVLLHDRVEIQGNTVVDRAVFGGFTELEEDVKVDNLVHIAHNVRVGKRSFIIALAMIGGSVTIGDDVWVGPGAVISNGLRIGDGAFITLGSVVTRDVAPNQRVTGNWAIEHKKFIAFLKTIR
jgi:acetyltransferase-like isoleucine patch superfamily enzyme